MELGRIGFGQLEKYQIQYLVTLDGCEIDPYDTLLCRHIYGKSREASTISHGSIRPCRFMTGGTVSGRDLRRKGYA